MTNKRRPRRRVAPPTPNRKTAKGIIIGEGYATCIKVGKYVYPRITLQMCDPVAAQKVADLFQTTVSTPPATAGRCPRTTDNPEGRAYITATQGKKARDIINQPELQGTDINRKAKKLKCFQ